MRKLALDIGTKTCGFAITDDLNIIASTLDTIYFEENDFDTIEEQINFYLNKYEIDSLIIGFPLRSNGAKSERTQIIEKLAHKYKKIYTQLKIFLVNEYGSTIKSTNILKEAKLSIKKRKKYKDQLSASIILEDFLNYGGKEVIDELN
ncbi:Holliday junction resolvase RuvX [Mycoplasmopsis lipofaciens]|uniref:Holliday junction resolvase RuvX n=1 Tax=Mycoplasmopsis lipofaciens TaxID=114884 RepID=UPI0004829306|nr:Holliday junction resolvase RuvX [Mycoplasmopsis lipofaciens]